MRSLFFELAYGMERARPNTSSTLNTFILINMSFISSFTFNCIYWTIFWHNPQALHLSSSISIFAKALHSIALHSFSIACCLNSSLKYFNVLITGFGAL